MKAIRIFVTLAILSVLLLFGCIALLAEPIDVKFNVFEFIAIKAIALGIMYVAYKGIVAVFQVLKVT